MLLVIASPRVEYSTIAAPRAHVAHATASRSTVSPPMRIAFEATALLDPLTGVGTFVDQVLRRLATREDLEVTAFGFTRAYRDELASAVPAGVRVPQRPIPARTTRVAWLLSNHPTIEGWTGPVDVVHGPNFVVPPTRKAAQLMTVHDLTSVRFREMCDRNTRQYPHLIRRALRRGAHVHTVSRSVADEVMDVFRVEPERVHVVPNGVDASLGGDASRGCALAGGDRYVLSIGTIEPRKNLAGLVRAFDRVAGEDETIRLALAGGSGWGAAGVDEAIASARHNERIARLGRVDDAERADLLAGATVLAYPSVYEGFGLPPLEAMAAGVSVLATCVGAIPEVLGDAALLVDLDDDSIAEGLLRLITDDSMRAQLVERGRARAAEYSWEATAAAMVEVYRELS